MAESILCLRAPLGLRTHHAPTAPNPAPNAVPPAPSSSGGLLSLDAARARMLAAVAPLQAQERAALPAALGRILAADVVVAAPVPAHANSAMDGYAVRGADLAVVGETTLRCSGTALAGHPFTGRVEAGACVRITTGAVLPVGADTVVMQEDTQVQGAQVRIAAGQRTGQHVRPAGDDLAPGMTALRAGRRLRAADLGLLASLGCADVAVRRRLCVAYFSTGDELRPLGQQLPPGAIHDSNRHVLGGLLAGLGAEVMDCGIVPDDPAALRALFEHVAPQVDAVLTSGGVSVGAADHVRAVLAEVGEVDFWKVNIKPGKPVAFGRLRGGALFIGLPGNPVAAVVTFLQLARPALERLAGAEPEPPWLLRARVSAAVRKAAGRREFLRGQLETTADGTLHVTPYGHQGSGVLRSMSAANCFIVLPEEAGAVAAGDLVQVQPFAGLL